MDSFVDDLSRAALQDLVSREPGPCVSIYMPMRTSSREVRQNPIRLRNLLDRAHEGLVSTGVRTPVADEILAPGRELLEDTAFWERRSQGIALFLARGFSRAYRLPWPFAELAVAGRRFHLKPLFPLFSGDGRFHLLALAQGGVRMFRGSRYEIVRIEVPGLPQDIDDALKLDTPESQLRFEVRQPGRPGGKPEAFGGQSVGTYDEKDPLRRYFRAVDRAVHDFLRDEHAPLVLAGVDYLLPLYREVNTYGNLLAEGVTGSPQGLKAEELHDAAWKVVEPCYSRAEAEARARFEQLAGRRARGENERLAASGVSEVVPAAGAGRVDSLFVAVDAHCWGRFDPESFSVEEHAAPQPGDEDLLDRAAVETFMKGGKVYAVPPEKVPGGGSAAALLRF